MRARLLIIGLLISSLFGYLEWSGGNHAFLYQTELEVIGKLFTEPLSVLHPFTLIPLTGQLLLLIAVFQKKPKRILVYIGIGCIGILFALMLFIGLIELHWKIILSVVPFFLFAFIIVLILQREHRSGHKGLI